MAEMKVQAKKRKWWFRFMKKLMLGRYKKPEFRYLGKEISTSAVILSNHEGTDAPMSFELYLDKPIRMWGAGEMNSGVVELYKYQTKVYYHKRSIGTSIWRDFSALSPRPSQTSSIKVSN